MRLPLLDKKEPQDDSIQWAFDNPSMVPSANLDQLERGERKTKRWRMLIKLSAICGPAALVFSLYNASGNAQQTPASTTAAGSNASSPGQFAATQAVTKWLASSPAPLPGGQLVSPDGSTPVAAGKGVDPKAAEKAWQGANWEVDNFILSDGAGNGYKASVEVAVTPDGQSQVVAGPSLVPLQGASQSLLGNANPWPQLESTTATAADTSAVNQWATAFTSGDPSQLAQAVGDPNADHNYLPLSGIASVTAKVLYAGAVDDATTVTQVQLIPVWNGQNDTSSMDSDQQPGITLDLVLTGANTAAPRVVAWGGPGTGPGLKPYANAIVSRGDQNSSAPVTPGPTQIPGPSTTTAPPPTPTQSSSAKPDPAATPKSKPPSHPAKPKSTKKPKTKSK